MIVSAVMELLAGTRRFKRVGDVLELAALSSEPTLAMQAAFVLPSDSSALPNDLGSNVFEQLITERVGVAIVVSADGARRGAAREELEELEAVVMGALASKTLQGFDRPTTFSDARLVGVSGGRVTRLLRFNVVRRFRVIRNPA
jgi:hypothetical protein